MCTIAAIAGSVARAPQPEAGLAILMAEFGRRPGYRLATVLLYDPDQGLCRRVWTSKPLEYPLGGAKPVQSAPWADRALFEGLPFHAPDKAAIQAAYADHETIETLGCASALNLPVRSNDRVIGTINLLHQAHHFESIDLARTEALAQLAAPLLANCLRQAFQG